MSRKVGTNLNLIRDPVPMTEPKLDVGRALHEVLRALHTVMERRMRSSGKVLSFAHTMLMVFLAREPGLSGAQAARRSHVTAQTMNGLLRNLEAAGYVAREPNPENRRADSWFLTQKGLLHLEKGKGVAEEVMLQMLEPLSERDTGQLCELLSKCAKSLRASSDPRRQAPKRRSFR